MLNEYLYEIIIAIVVISLLAIFILLKSLKKSSSEPDDVADKLDEAIEEEADKDKGIEKESIQVPSQDSEEEAPIQDLATINLGGSEEGDFGEPYVEEAPEEELTEGKKIHKREVPPHAKITKQNFSEFSGARLLVAEDNLINQKVISGLLADSGIELVIADDGQEALDILEQDDNFLMVLMDAHMPRVDGFQATREIRKNPKYDHILVVALSGDTAADDIAKMTNAGMAEHLEKPLRMEALYDILYAYSGEENNSDASEYIEVIMTKELNGDQGLEICGEDVNFYHEILSEFVSTYEHSTQDLSKFLHANELQKADKLLLDIIGVTANIGAQPLHTIALEIKNALEDPEKSYLTLADEYHAHLENLIKDIKDYR